MNIFEALKRSRLFSTILYKSCLMNLAVMIEILHHWLYSFKHNYTIKLKQNGSD